MQVQRNTRRKTAREILLAIPNERPAIVWACRRCGTIGCRPELHEDAAPVVRVPLVARLMA